MEILQNLLQKKNNVVKKVVPWPAGITTRW